MKFLKYDMEITISVERVELQLDWTVLTSHTLRDRIIWNASYV